MFLWRVIDRFLSLLRSEFFFEDGCSMFLGRDIDRFLS
jgi:hypothetical protein